MEMHPDCEKILFSEQEIQKRVQELADQINTDYKGKQLVCVGILKGAFMFMAELVKRIELDVKLEFMAISSYGDAAQSSGTVRILMDTRTDLADKHVLIIEDIVDTGLTLKYLLNTLQPRNLASVKVCVLLRKPENAKCDIAVDYLGFDIPNAFVVGMGLDYAERLRQLPYIAVLKESCYK